jgi:SpoVK/Ycf46/Vps4 family AAA+-type ATPase
VTVFELTSLNPERPSQAVFSWSGEYTDDDQLVEVSGLFAAQLGFRDGDEVLIRLQNDRVARCRQAQIEPRSQYDWEEFERYGSEIEQNLLNQVRVVWPGMTLPIWVQSNLVCLMLTVGQVHPNESPVLLETNTELVRTPPRFVTSGQTDADTSIHSEESKRTVSSKQTGLLTRLFSIAGLMDNGSSTSGSAVKQATGTDRRVPLDCLPQLDLAPRPIFRVIPMESLSEQKSAINTVFVSCAYSDPQMHSNELTFVAKLSRLLSPMELRLGKESTKSTSDNDSDQLISTPQAVSTIVRVQLFTGLATDSIGVSEGLRRQLALFTNCRCTLESLDLLSRQPRNESAEQTDKSEFTLATALTLTPILLPILSQSGQSDETRNKLLRDLKDMVNQQQLLILTQNTLLTFSGKDTIVTFDFEQQNANDLLLIDADCLAQLQIRVLEPLSKKRKTKWNVELPFSTLNDLEQKFVSPFVYPVTDLDDGDGITGFDNELDHLASYVNLCFSQNGTVSCLPSLIVGPWGSGKSTLIAALVHRIRASRRDVYVSRIDCRKLRGKRVEPLRKQLALEFDECAYRQPSLLLLENLDCLACTMTGVEDKQEQIHLERCALLIRNLISQTLHSKLLYGSKVAIVASAKSTFDLHSGLLPASGEHLFQETIQLAAPNVEQRSKIMKQLLSIRLTRSKLDWNALQMDATIATQLTDGCLPIDLRLLIDKAIHRSALDRSALNLKHFKMAADEYTPIALRGLNLRPSSRMRWQHVGGLHQVKRVLTETLLWPTRYSSLFEQLPIRPQSSVLLYGPPGTGKTLLAEALANECNTRFICVRGPELLSKYIGASEAAIRALFERANQSAPCIVFFDEIDAIAPARGHDSTGVTDRVVNQILTQMDGIEQLKSGVHVLAATSRPDMLDKALLRPGRFDLTLCCPLPDRDERKEILQKLCERISDGQGQEQSQSITIESNVDFEVLADKSEHFSGADLHALLYNSLLESLYDQIYEKESDSQSEQKIEQLLNNQGIDELVDQLNCLKVNQGHFERALTQTNPSISSQERLRYEQL